MHVLPEGLPPHPALRTARQWQPRRQHRAGARAARRAVPPKRTRDARSSDRRTPHAAASMPLLRRPHVHHRDLRARQRAEAPTHARAGRDQDRHLMMPSPPIDDRTDARHSGRLSPGSTPARIALPDSPAIARPILSRNARPLVHTDAHPRACQKPIIATAPLHFPNPSPRQIPIAPAAPSVPHLPRFRALALFGRRPSERVDGLVMPASENLHMNGTSCTAANGKRHPYSITSSARTSNEGGTVRPSALAVFRLITSSNLVGCSTGRSAGLVPLRILST